jgi:hypothetical protein
MNRKALLLAILFEVVLFSTLLVSIGRCRPLTLILRIIHAPAAGWYIFFTDWLALPPNLDYWASRVFAFSIQTFIWYALLCQLRRVRGSASVVHLTKD